jgi:hypothetical protein
MEASTAQFGVIARIAKGKVPLWGPTGTVTIEGDRLHLRKRNGTAIAEYPVKSVRAASLKRNAGASVRIWADSDTYILDWGRVLEGTPWALGEIGAAIGALGQVPRKRAITTAFLDELQAKGGQIDGREQP